MQTPLDTTDIDSRLEQLAQEVQQLDQQYGFSQNPEVSAQNTLPTPSALSGMFGGTRYRGLSKVE